MGASGRSDAAPQSIFELSGACSGAVQLDGLSVADLDLRRTVVNADRSGSIVAVSVRLFGLRVRRQGLSRSLA
jgi:hypothetical protein